MLYLKKGQVSKVFLTLADLQTVPGAHYLFVFENRATGENVSWVENASGDVSLYPDRYNAFNITVNDYFTSATTGTWIYKIYEQPSLVNLDPELATGLLESGLAQVQPASDPVTTRYEGQDNTYKVYSQ